MPFFFFSHIHGCALPAGYVWQIKLHKRGHRVHVNSGVHHKLEFTFTYTANPYKAYFKVIQGILHQGTRICSNHMRSKNVRQLSQNVPKEIIRSHHY